MLVPVRVDVTVAVEVLAVYSTSWQRDAAIPRWILLATFSL
jgi:hypothetical protein